jgi:hypothetical protein
MESNQETPFETRCNILGDLWTNYKHEEDLEDFVDYNDIGLPLAFTVAEDMSKPTSKGIAFINETWNILLKTLDIEEDTGFESLDDLLIG